MANHFTVQMPRQIMAPQTNTSMRSTNLGISQQPQPMIIIPQGGRLFSSGNQIMVQRPAIPSQQYIQVANPSQPSSQFIQYRQIPPIQGGQVISINGSQRILAPSPHQQLQPQIRATSNLGDSDASVKLHSFFSKLLTLSKKEGYHKYTEVKDALQQLMDGRLDTPSFCERLGRSHKSTPSLQIQDTLQRNLLMFRQRLASGQFQLEGIKPPKLNSVSSQPQQVIQTMQVLPGGLITNTVASSQQTATVVMTPNGQQMVLNAGTTLLPSQPQQSQLKAKSILQSLQSPGQQQSLDGSVTRGVPTPNASAGGSMIGSPLGVPQLSPADLLVQQQQQQNSRRSVTPSGAPVTPVGNNASNIIVNGGLAPGTPQGTPTFLAQQSPQQHLQQPSPLVNGPLGSPASSIPSLGSPNMTGGIVSPAMTFQQHQRRQQQPIDLPSSSMNNIANNVTAVASTHQMASLLPNRGIVTAGTTLAVPKSTAASSQEGSLSRGGGGAISPPILVGRSTPAAPAAAKSQPSPLMTFNSLNNKRKSPSPAQSGTPSSRLSSHNKRPRLEENAMPPSVQQQRSSHSRSHHHRPLGSGAIAEGMRDDEINDVATMGGVNLIEESRSFLTGGPINASGSDGSDVPPSARIGAMRKLYAPESSGTSQGGSIMQPVTLSTRYLFPLNAMYHRIRKLAERQGILIAPLNSPSTVPISAPSVAANDSGNGNNNRTEDIVELLCQGTRQYVESMLEKLTFIASARNRNIRRLLTEQNLENFSSTSPNPSLELRPIAGQLAFLRRLDIREKQEHQDREAERLMRAAKGRSKNDTPELKQRAKEFRDAQLEEVRAQEANATALAAITGNSNASRKRKLLETESINENALSASSSNDSRATSQFSTRDRFINNDAVVNSNTDTAIITNVKSLHDNDTNGAAGDARSIVKTSSSSSAKTTAGLSLSLRNRIIRRDIQYVLEQNRRTRRSPILYKSFASTNTTTTITDDISTMMTSSSSLMTSSYVSGDNRGDNTYDNDHRLHNPSSVMTVMNNDDDNDKSGNFYVTSTTNNNNIDDDIHNNNNRNNNTRSILTSPLSPVIFNGGSYGVDSTDGTSGHSGETVNRMAMITSDSGNDISSV